MSKVTLGATPACFVIQLSILKATSDDGDKERGCEAASQTEGNGCEAAGSCLRFEFNIWTPERIVKKYFEIMIFFLYLSSEAMWVVLLIYKF